MSKAIQNILIIVGLVIVSISCSSVCANAEPSTSSPYFFVKSDIEQLDVLPLKHTEVQVDIALSLIHI